MPEKKTIRFEPKRARRTTTQKRTQKKTTTARKAKPKVESNRAHRAQHDQLEKTTAEVKPVKKAVKKYPYIFAVGRRKSAVARVRLYTKDNRGEIKVNEKDYKEYFPYFEFYKNIEEPLKKCNLLGKYFISIKVQGGGKRGQADAACHGLGRVLLKFDDNLKKTLRASGYLTRDSRKKERKKPGLKRARRAPQWQKR